MVLEVSDGVELTRAAVDYVQHDETIPDEELTHTVSAVSDGLGGASESVAYLVDPLEMVRHVPGVELAQASWSSEMVDPASDDPGVTGGWDGERARFQKMPQVW